MGYSGEAPKKLKKIEKAREVTFSPLPPAYTLNPASTKFGMWGRVADVINRATFQLNPFSGFGAPGGQKSPFPID